MVIRADFEAQLKQIFQNAKNEKRKSIRVNSGELHRLVGDYPGRDHRMPICCSVMKKAMRSGDLIISEPPKGQGASLTIEYQLI